MGSDDDVCTCYTDNYWLITISLPFQSTDARNFSLTSRSVAYRLQVACGQFIRSCMVQVFTEDSRASLPVVCVSMITPGQLPIHLSTCTVYPIGLNPLYRPYRK